MKTRICPFIAVPFLLVMVAKAFAQDVGRYVSRYLREVADTKLRSFWRSATLAPDSKSSTQGEARA
jgi:hypothetical protein